MESVRTRRACGVRAEGRGEEEKGVESTRWEQGLGDGAGARRSLDPGWEQGLGGRAGARRSLEPGWEQGLGGRTRAGRSLEASSTPRGPSF